MRIYNIICILTTHTHTHSPLSPFTRAPRWPQELRRGATEDGRCSPGCCGEGSDDCTEVTKVGPGLSYLPILPSPTNFPFSPSSGKAKDVVQALNPLA